MARSRERERRRAGSAKRDAQHRAGGDWTSVKIPANVELFQPKEGTFRFDIVPFKAGKGNPYADIGEEYYERTFYIHPRIGVNNETVICPAKTAKLPCPICEHRAAVAKDPDGDESLVKDLKPKERQIFLIHVYGKEDAPQLMLYESSFHTFGELLDQRRRDAESDEAHISDFDDPAAGSTLKVSYAEQDAGGFKFLKAYSIDFKPRANGLDGDLLDHGICLDDCLSMLSYEELKRRFLQVSEPEEDDDDDKPAPVKKKSTSKVEPDEPEESPTLEKGMTVRHRTLGVCKIDRVSKDGTSLILVDDDGEIHKPVDAKEVKIMGKAKTTLESEEEENPAPKKEKAKPVQKPKDDDDDWGDEDDEPAPKKSQPAKSKVVDDDDDDEPKPKSSGKKAKPSDDDDWD